MTAKPYRRFPGKRPRGGRGFTLIELMIALAVVALLAMVALPAYQSQVQKSRRADAKVALMNAAQALERCAANDPAAGYTAAGCPSFPKTSSEGFYSITAPTLTATTYTLTAQPVADGPQAGDAQCASLSLDQTGTRTSSPGDDCW